MLWECGAFFCIFIYSLQLCASWDSWLEDTYTAIVGNWRKGACLFWRAFHRSSLTCMVSQLSALVRVTCAILIAICGVHADCSCTKSESIFREIPINRAALVIDSSNGTSTSARKIAPGCTGFRDRSIIVSLQKYNIILFWVNTSIPVTNNSQFNQNHYLFYTHAEAQSRQVIVRNPIFSFLLSITRKN